MSILEKEYKLANFKEVEIPSFYSEANVSLIDILANREIEVTCLDYKDCVCQNSSNSSLYFKECSKCNSTGYININGHDLICNECKGKGKIRIKDCYLCNNKGKILLNSKVKLNLNPSYLENNEYVINHKDYNLIIKLNVYDKKDYYIDNDDIYYLKTIYCSKQDHLKHKKFEINTVVDTSYVESEFKVNKEIVCLKNKGLNNKNFYFTFENEIEVTKEELYTNVVGESGYTTLDKLIKNEYVFLLDRCPLDTLNKVYISKDDTQFINDKYIINLNKLNKNDFIKKNNKAYLKVELTKDDVDTDKKTVVVNNENINLNYRKNNKNIEYYDTYSKCVKDKQGKRNKLYVIIYPYFENVYKISILENKMPVYVEDYKYFNYELVDSFNKEKYLTDPIKIDKQEEIVVGNDLLKIRRVKE